MKGLVGSMKRGSSTLMLLTGIAFTAASPALGQIRPMGVPAPAATQPRPNTVPPKVAPDAPVPGNPDFQADQSQAAPVPAPPPLPPAMWDMPSVMELATYIQQIGVEGLNPADYDLPGLQAAMQTGDPAAISAAATQRFNMVSSDLALGHVKKPARIDWWVVDPDLNAAKQDTLLRAALAQHSLTASLNALLPTHPQYAALKEALAATPATDEAKRNRIRLNLDRWRWLPRDLGNKYIIVNVPGFHATLVENGV